MCVSRAPNKGHAVLEVYEIFRQHSPQLPILMCRLSSKCFASFHYLNTSMRLLSVSDAIIEGELGTGHSCHGITFASDVLWKYCNVYFEVMSLV